VNSFCTLLAQKYYKFATNRQIVTPVAIIFPRLAYTNIQIHTIYAVTDRYSPKVRWSVDSVQLSYNYKRLKRGIGLSVPRSGAATGVAIELGVEIIHVNQLANWTN
jgi:hypothetical protein